MSFTRSSAMIIDRDMNESDIAIHPWKAATASLPVLLIMLLFCCVASPAWILLCVCLISLFLLILPPCPGVWVSVVIAVWMWGRAEDILMLWSSPPLQCL